MTDRDRSNKTPSERSSKRWLFCGCLLLVANTVYLSLDANPHPFYFLNLVAHVGLGLLLVVPAALWWLRHRNRWTDLATASLTIALVLGLALAQLGNTQPHRTLLIAHIVLAALGLVFLALGLHQLTPPSNPRTLRWAQISALVVILAAILAPWIKSAFPGGATQIVNPSEVPLAMDQEAMGGADGPFFPSSVHTSNRDTVPSSVYMGSESCSRSGCHPDVFEQWQSSAHHFSSFNNQWYRKSIEYLQETAGITPTKWCGGCHDPALLQTGLMDRPIHEVVDTPEAQAGLGCTACHMISKVRSTSGQGDYEITIPPLHDLATSEQPVLRWMHDFILKLDPEPHRRTFLKPILHNEFSAEFCSSCHKVHLDVPVNNYRWIRGFNEYDNWQASGVSGQGARSFYYPPEPKMCRDCHMPLVSSTDAGNDDGKVRSHRFPGANTALPVANQDLEQLQTVEKFLSSNQVTIDIFAMTEGSPIVDRNPNAKAAREGGETSSTFAVGEEQAFAVTAASTVGPVEAIRAPLDRVRPTLVRGESVRVDVVVRTRGVGHFFPGGTVDAYDCWLELSAVDDQGKVVFWSGQADLESPVESGAHFYRSLMIDEHGNPINKRNAPMARAVVYVRLIPPGAADTVRFRLDVPPEVSDQVTFTARLNYRKFSWFNTHWAYAGEPDPESVGDFSADYDDRTFRFTGDTADVSGALKEIPTLPIVVMAEDTLSLPVADSEPPSNPVATAEIDRERWNDYGIGLLRQGDLRAAEMAFLKVTELEPTYVDGWVNLGRVALAEGNLPRGLEVLEQALELEPTLARAHYFSGLATKSLGEYPRALDHLRTAAEQYPRDRVVRNQIARVLFLSRDYAAVIPEVNQVLAIAPEDLMAHYTAMLAHRGLGNQQQSEYHQARYERFKADESSQSLTGAYREQHPEDNNERLPIHEHGSVDLTAISTPVDPLPR